MSLNRIEFLYEKIRDKAIKFEKNDGPLYRGTYGRFEWLFSFHDFFVDPDALDAFATEFWNRFSEHAPLQVGGMEISGVPLVIAVVQKAKELGIEATGFFVRKERKTGGFTRIIGGDLNDQPIVIVDDVFKSGRTMEKVRVSLNSVGKELKYACTMVDFEKDEGKEWARNKNISVETFFDLSEFGLDATLNSDASILDRRNTAQIVYEPLWHFASPDPLPTYVVPKSAPLLEKNKLFFGSDSGVFWALDANSGEVVWQYDAQVLDEKGIWSSPAYYNNNIFFGAYNGNIYCLESETGDVVWISPACEYTRSSPLVVPSQGIVVIGLEYTRENGQGGIAALDIATGDKIWEHQLDRPQHGSAVYWAEKNLIITGSNNGTLLALDASDGKVVWELKAIGPTKYPPSICTKRRIVASASHDRKIRVASLDSGKLLFEIETSDICYTTPLIYENFLFCGSGDKFLYIINIEKQELEKKIPTKGRIYSSPALVDGNVIFGNSAGVLEELNGHNLATEHAVVFPDSITNKVAVSPDGATIYIPTYMNEIYAMKRRRS